MEAVETESAQDIENVKIWHQVLKALRDVSCPLTAALQERHNLGLSEFEVLERVWTLGAEHNYECLLKRLESDVHLSQSALSRTVTRLQKLGLVERVRTEQDSRAAKLQLTEAGREKFLEAKPTHREILRQVFENGDWPPQTSSSSRLA